MLYRLLFFICYFLTLSCTGSLTDDQRKQLQKEMKSRAIKKISEGEIMEAALQQSRAIQKMAEEHFDVATSYPDHDLIKSFETEHNLRLKWLNENSTSFSEKEQQLFEAYMSSPVTTDVLDNIQKLGQDSILYTKPIFQLTPSAEQTLLGMWSITSARKEVIRKM